MDAEQSKKWLERYERNRKVFCPHCGEEHEDEYYECVSLYGTEKELWEVTCINCEKIYYVEEVVDRTYKSMKSQEERGTV